MDNDPQNPFEEIIAASRRNARIRGELHKLVEAASEHTENHVLMPLWKELGDQTPNYHQAFQAAHAWFEMDKFVMDVLDRISGEETRTHLLEAFGKTLLQRAELYRQTIAKRLELQHANPIPGDHA